MLNQTAKKVLGWISLACATQLMAPPAVWSASLNLSSTVHNVPAGSIAGFHPTAITIGGQLQQITGNTMLTLSEVQAVIQVLNSGTQSLVLSPGGSAVGGSLVVNQSSTLLGAMIVPRNVSLVDNLTRNNVAIAGGLSNAGSLYFAGTPAATVLNVSALNITNQQGALLSSLMPGVGLALSAVRNISNAGTISSAGDLSLRAGGSISNAGIIDAANSVNLSAGSGSYFNAGSIAAATGDVNFINGALATNLSVLGTGGVIAALQGNINFRDASYAGKGNITLQDGDYLSQAMNLFAGCGKITANVGNVTGVVNMTAKDAHFNADTPNLQMGTWTVTNDPMLTNTGNVDITGLAAAGGKDFIILAGGNITSSSNSFVIDTHSTTASGGNVVLVAGANFKGGTISGGSSSGGDIILGTVGAGANIIDTHTTFANGSGGNVTLIAFQNGNNSAGGNISLNGTSTITTTAPAGTGSNGNVLIIGGAQTTGGGLPTLAVGNIATNGGSAKGGSIVIQSTTPQATASSPVVLNTSTGAITSGSFLGGAVQSGAISTNNLTTNGQPVTLEAGTNFGGATAITANAITTSAPSIGNGGAVSVVAGATSNGGSNGAGVNIASIATSGNGSGKTSGSVTVTTTGSIQVTGATDTSGINGANGGGILLAAEGTGGDNITITGINSSGANGGNVQLLSSGNIQGSSASSPQVNSSASATGTAGNVTLVAGASVSTSGSTIISGPSTSAGNINFSPTTDTINATGLNGGNITLVAYGNLSPNGLITVPGNLNSNGSGSGTNGNIQVVGGATSSAGTPTTISLANVNTASGGPGGSGNVTVITGQPSAAVTLGSDGSVTNGSFTTTTAVSGVVNVGTINTTGGNVTITAGRNAGAGTAAITTQSINTSADLLAAATDPSQDGGNVILTAGFGGATKQDIVVNGTVTTVGFNSQGVGGAVVLNAQGSVTVSGLVDTGDAASAATGAQAGNVAFNAGTALSDGSITFNQIKAIGPNGGAVQMIAAGNISSASTSLPIDTQANTPLNLGNAGNVLLVAGALATIGNVTTTISGASGFGGNVSLNSVVGTAIDTDVVGRNGSGGSVTMAAFANTAQSAGGQVTLSGGINTVSNITGISYNDPFQGGAQGTNRVGGSGNVIVVAEGPSTSGPTINLTSINTSGTVDGSGAVTLVTASPNTASAISVNTAGGNLVSGSFLGGTLRSGAVQLQSISTNGANIEILAGSDTAGGSAISITGAVNTHASSSIGGNGGYVILESGLDGNTANTNIQVGSDINTWGITPPVVAGFVAPPKGTGGTVAIVTPGSISLANVDTGDNNSAGITGTGANGGHVLMLAGSTATAGVILFGNISTNGGTNAVSQAIGYGGNVELISIGTVGAGNITGTNITTNSNSISNGSAGMVAISTATGAITLNSISTTATGITGLGTDIVLSSGKTSGTAVTVSTLTTPGLGTTQDTFVFITSSAAAVVPSTACVVSAAVQALPTGKNTLQFAIGATSQVQALDASNTPEAIFYSPGGFTSTSSPITLQITGPSQMILPIVSLSASGVTLASLFSNSLISTNMPVLLAGNSVDLEGALTQSQPISAIASGPITLLSTQQGGNPTAPLNIGTIVSTTSFSAGITGNISLFGPIIAPTTSLVAVDGTGHGGSITYAFNIPQPIITNHLTVQADTFIGTQQFPLVIDGSGDAVTLNNVVAAAIYLRVLGNAYLNNVSTTLNYRDTSSGALFANTAGNILVLADSKGGDDGSITLGGAISAPTGYIGFFAESGISTSGNNVTIVADGKTGENGQPFGGNNIYLVAGADLLLQNSGAILTIPTRSGRGGDISLPGLSEITAFTDINGNGGQISLVAYSATANGVIGGNISYPSGVTVGSYNPPFAVPNPSSGIIIVGEAAGGPVLKTTINIGDVYGGSGSINIWSANPNTTPTTPTLINVFDGSQSGAKFYGGGIQLNASVNTGILSLIGIIQSPSPTNGQGITVVAGGALTTLDVVSVGEAGWTPVPFLNNGIPQPPNPLTPQSLNGFSGGAGAPIQLSANQQVVVNGDLASYGGGGAGGLGAPFVETNNIIPQGAPGGNGGNGGSGGNISVSSNFASITVTGTINSSGGGGGGGGGGYGGQTVGQPGAGGSGGGGGAAGFVSLVAGSKPGSTIAVGGPIYAVAGANGGHGGSGNFNGLTGFGGSGGGGGGSYGSGGGGGGGGVSEPQGTAQSGFGGAGGGGLAGGGGGDIQNVLIVGGSISYTGFGGWGGGGRLANPNTTPNGTVVGGDPGGLINFGDQQNGATLFFAGQFGTANVGGNGGTYNSNGVTGGTPLEPAAIGGSLGGGGAGGAAGDINAPAGAGAVGSDVLHHQSFDGAISLSAFSFTTPSTMIGGAFSLSTPNSLPPSNQTTNPGGTLTIGGNIIATGFFNNPGTLGAATFTARVSSSTGGDLIISPSTTIDVYNGSIQLENDNPNGIISIGAKSLIFANGPGASVNVSMGQPTFQQTNPVAAVLGKAPTNVKVVSATSSVPANNVFFGNAGLTAVAPQNVVYAVGTGARVVFQSGWSAGTFIFGNKNSIQLGGGVQIGAAAANPLTSLDLTDSNTVQTIVSDQQLKAIGGTLKFTDINGVFTATGGTMILYPLNLTNTISSLDIPLPTSIGATPLTVTLANFAVNNPITILITASSTQKNIIVNSPLVYNGTVAVDGILNVSSNLAPTVFVGPKGSINSTGNFTLTTPGLVSVSGPISAAGQLSLTTTATDLLSPATPSMVISANVSGTKELTLSTQGTLNLAAGTLTGTATIDLISSQLTMTKGKIADTAGTVIIEPSNAATPITVGSGLGFNPTTTDLLAIKAKTVQIGSLSDSGSITVNVPLNVTSATVGVGVGTFNLDFETTGAFSSSGNAFTLGSKSLTVNADAATLNTITGGGTVHISGSNGITVPSGIQGTTSTLLVLQATNGVITSGQALKGKSLTIGGEIGTTTSVSTNAPTVAYTSGDVTVNDTAVSITINASTGHNVSLVDSTDKSKIVVSKSGMSVHDLTLNAGGATLGSIVLNGNIAATDIVSLGVTGKGTITQSPATVLLTAPIGLTLTSGTGAIGASSTKLNVIAPTVTVASSGATFLADNATSVTVNANLSALTLTSTGSGVTVNNNAAGAFTLNPSTSNGLFQLVTTGTGAVNVLGITVNAPSSSNIGGIAISSTSANAGPININGNLSDVGGAASGFGILVKSANTTNGAINVKPAAKLTTLAVGPGKPNANIALVIDSTIQQTNAVASLAGFKITGTGQVFAGPNAGRVSVSSGTANINLIGANMIFDVNSGTAKITIGSGALLQPDPTTTTTVQSGGTQPVSNIVQASSSEEIIVDSADDEQSDILVSEPQHAVGF